MTRTTLPAVDLQTLDGKPARLDELARGRPVLVSLWATWCDACAREFDALARLDEAVRGEGAAVIAIAVGEPLSTVASFVQRRALPYPQLVDEHFQLADAIGQTRVPATLVLGRDGRVLYRGGAFDQGALMAFRAAVAEARAAVVTEATGRPDHAAR
ncbi:MAG: Thiol:disulfide oxidoreductase related to ResA [Myxococcales bacterium]|nr:Thiol:disulfide oxidoreductase related to ResA [Myxococcales bacterium]